MKLYVDLTTGERAILENTVDILVNIAYNTEHNIIDNEHDADYADFNATIHEEASYAANAIENLRELIANFNRAGFNRDAE